MTTRESAPQLATRATGWRLFQALVAAFLGSAVVLSWDLYRSPQADLGVLSGSLLRSLSGFAASLCLVIAPVLALANWLSMRRTVWARLGLCLLFAPIFYWLSAATLVGGWARQFAFGGLGLHVIAAALALAASLAFWAWDGLLQGRGPVVRSLVLMGAVALVHEIDRRVYVGLYPVQHAVLGLLTYYWAAQVVLWWLPKRRLDRFAWLALGLLVVLSGHHLWSFYEDPMTNRRLIAGQDGLVSTRTLRRFLPYQRYREPKAVAAELSASYKDWQKRSAEARTAFSELAPAGPLDLIILSVDAIGSRHTSLHGRDLTTTPFLREFAKECLDFESARSSSTASFFSLTAMLSGAYPSTVSLLRGKDPEYLAEAMSRAGYQTFGYYTDAIFTARPPQWTPPDQRLGFEHFRLSTELSQDLLPMLLDLVSAQTEPYFLFTHLMDPHAPYEVHEDFNFGTAAQERYYSELAHTDQQLGIFIEALRAMGRLERSIIVITSDHGEAFGEHGSLLHGGVPYDEQCEVPLLIRLPQFPEGLRIAGPVSQTSLAPTLTDILGLDRLRDSEARSLLPRIMGMAQDRELFAVVERPTLFDAATWPAITALIHGQSKIIHDHDAGVVQFFDLAQDPLEKDDRADQESEALSALLALEDEWRADRRLLRARRSDLPLDLLKWRERLRDGHAEAAADLSVYLESQDPAQRLEAALGFHDAILAGTIPLDQLAAAALKTQDAQLLALVDLLKSAEERRPWLARTDLINDPDLRLRRRATTSLWRMREAVFTAPIARARLAVETDLETRADLLGVVLENDPSASEISLAIDLLALLEGDVVGRLAFSILSLDDAQIGEHYERLVRHEDARIMMSVLESIGANDTPRRRGTMERFLRIANVTLRRIAIRGLRNFPPSRWKHDLLVNLVRREPHDEMRILAGLQANEFRDAEVSAAFLDALALYPVTGLGFGHLLATERLDALESWDLREAETNGDLIVGGKLHLQADLQGAFGRRGRRLLLTVLRRPGLDHQDDFIRVYGPQDELLLEQKHIDLAVMYYLELPMAGVTAAEYPLRIEIGSLRRPQGENFGQIFATLIRSLDLASVWPPNQENFHDVAILARFSPHWECRVHDQDTVYLTADQGELRMIGNGVGAETLHIDLVGGVADCEMELLLNGTSLGTVAVKAHEQQSLSLTNLQGSYERQHLNRLRFHCRGWRRPPSDGLVPEWRLGLLRVVWE